MNAITKQELEKAGPISGWAIFAEMPPAQQRLSRDLNEPVLDNHEHQM
jgi:hypothetical protein